MKIKNGNGWRPEIRKFIFNALHELIAVSPRAFMELVEKCQAPEHDIPKALAEELIRRDLLGADLTVPASVKSVVLNAVRGQGENMKLVSPWLNE